MILSDKLFNIIVIENGTSSWVKRNNGIIIDTEKTLCVDEVKICSQKCCVFDREDKLKDNWMIPAC